MELRNKETVEQNPKNETARVEIPARLFAKIDNTGKSAKPENLSRPPQIGYIDDISKVDKADIKEAGERIMRAYDFIKNHAETPVERKTAEVLSLYINSGKVQLSDTTERMGRSCYGFFRPHKNPEYSYIGIDMNIVMEKGVTELVDTLFHEAYHAAQYKAGHKNNEIKEEIKAWNLGLEMSNKYRGEHDEKIVRTKPYTEQDMRGMGYINRGDHGGFTEICKEAV